MKEKLIENYQQQPFSYITHLECSICLKIFDCDQIQNFCKECNKPLVVRYDLNSLKNNWNKSMLLGREPSLWRYRELLPIKNQENIVSFGEGMSPLWRANNLEKKLGLRSLYIKDESQMPTSTFKSRGASVALSRAKELGIKRVALPSNGNAGSACASYSVKAGMEAAYIAMPVDGTKSAKDEALAFGAKLFLVDGLISDCGRIISEFVKMNPSVFEISTLKEPYRLEGKKTMGFEIAEQLLWKLPDVIIYPTGGGVGIIAIHKAFLELKELGWIEGPLPRFISVQAKSCCPLKIAHDNQEKQCVLYENASTIATGIRVPKSFGDFMILDILNKTNGTVITVEEEEILEMYKEIPRVEGSLLSVEGAAAFAGLRQAIKEGLVSQSDNIVVVNTGSGVKTPGIIEYEQPPIIHKDTKLSFGA